MVTKQIIAIVDPGIGNVQSVKRAVAYCSNLSRSIIVVTCSQNQIEEADKVIFPGQGAARDCMLILRRTKLDNVLKQACRSKPFLGICMGMQVLMDFSQENHGTDCLRIIAGNSQPLIRAGEHKIPHIGWNAVKQVKKHALWRGITDNDFFYFDHSYSVNPKGLYSGGRNNRT